MTSKLVQIAASALLFGALAAAPAVRAQTPVKIGFVAELSGPQASLGQDQYDGFMLYLERNGGKLGNVPIEVIKEDSQLKPEIGVQVVNKLIQREHVSIITGVTYSQVMMAIHKPVTEAKVFLVSSLAGPSPIAGALCSPYQFVMSFQNDLLAETYAQFANERGYKRVMFMAPNIQAGKDFVAGFKRAYKGEIVDEVYTALSATDFSAELTRVSVAKPDALYAFYPGAAGINFVRQYAQVGLLKSTPLLSQASVEGSTLGAMQDTAIGVYNSAAWGPDLDNAANKRFVADFEKRFDRPPTLYAALSYDAAQLIDSVLRKTGGRVDDKAALQAAFKSADFDSVRGKFRFGTNNFPIQNYYVHQVVKDDKGRVSLKTIATPLKDAVDPYAAKCAMK